MNNLTINEIAKLAGVSKGTVSKVLNDYPGISEKTRERVVKVVKQMGYEPNSAAQALASKQTGNIGLVIPHSPRRSLNGAYWSSLVTVVTNEVIARGYSLVLLLPKVEGNLSELFTSIVRKRQMDGLIIGAELLDTKQLATIMYNEMPFVMIGRNPAFTHYYVDIDNEGAAYGITRYLQDRGFGRIAFVTGPADYYYNAARLAGYERAIAERRGGYSVCINLPYDDRIAMTQRLTELVRDRAPDAVLCGAGGDFMFDCLNIFKALDIGVPGMGFATFDDYRYLDFTSPRITAVSQPLDRIGEEAVRMLDDLIRGRPLESLSTVLPTEIVVRNSCGE
jgi:LacI family transcriptional regulator